MVRIVRKSGAEQTGGEKKAHHILIQIESIIVMNWANVASGSTRMTEDIDVSTGKLHKQVVKMMEVVA